MYDVACMDNNIIINLNKNKNNNRIPSMAIGKTNKVKVEAFRLS